MTQLNRYIEAVGGLGARYNVCKQACLEKDPELAKEIKKREEN